MKSATLCSLAFAALLVPACVNLTRPPEIVVGDEPANGGSGGATAPVVDGGVVDERLPERDVSAGDMAVDATIGVDSPPSEPDGAMTDTPASAKRGLGAACALASECESGFCTENVCCNSACLGNCQTCALANDKGSCLIAPAGTDPKNACPDDGVASCLRNGWCDGAGAGACQLYSAGTICAGASCSNGQLSTQAICEAGLCRAQATSSCLPYVCGSDTACRSSCTTKADCGGIAECFSGVCGGLLGTYFAVETLMGRSVTRIDRNIDFLFDGSPIATIPADLFSIRWTGKVVAPTTGTYTFSTLGDDGVRLWVNDQQLINDWRVHTPGEFSGQIAMTAGRPVPIKLEYFDSSGGGTIRLSWAGPGVTKQIIPATAFRPE